MDTNVIPFPAARRPKLATASAPQSMWRVEGWFESGPVAVLLDDTREAIGMLFRGWNRVVLVYLQPDGSYALSPSLEPAL